MNLVNYFKVVIVGRPNVGKSSLFNRILGKRVAIVDFVSGITRDRIYGKVSRQDKMFYLVDTGGYFEAPETNLENALLEQVKEGIEEADLILFVMDAQNGLHPMDKQIYLNLRRSGKPVLFVVNKSDNSILENQAYEFTELGIESFFPVSAQHNMGIKKLEEAILSYVPEAEPVSEKAIRISVVGKPNAGKSSLINKIINSRRMIVDERPGTTRDAVEIDFCYEGKLFTLVDTAGLTRRSRVKEAVDSYSIMRTKDAIEQSDFVVLMMDAERHVESQDARIARMVADMGRSCFIVVNKWDLTKNVRQEHYTQYVYDKMPFISYAPLLYVSVLKGKNHEKVMKMAYELVTLSYNRIPTSVLNNIMETAYQRNLPPMVAGKRLKIYYCTQIQEAPPVFMLSINSLKSAVPHYLKYLENQIRNHFEFRGMPIQFKLRPKISNSKRGDD